MIEFVGIEKTIQNLEKIARNLPKESNNALFETAEIGFNIANAKAPEHTGALKKAMKLEFPNKKEAWIISSTAPEDFGFPVQIAFDTGDFGKMTMWGPGFTRVPFRPKRQSSIGFMRTTADFLDDEFARRVGLAVKHSIER